MEIDREQLVEVFLAAYRQGAFPMAEPARTPRGRVRANRRIDWFIPDPRAIIPLDPPPGEPGGFHVPRSLARTVRRNPFQITSDQAFGAVIRACAEPRPWRDDTWLDDRLIHAYEALHAAGHAHSIEAWRGEGEHRRLVGGIYGVHFGGAFCAESMFCDPDSGGTDASKICLVNLVSHLVRQEFGILDVQISNAHTARFGVIEVPADQYLRELCVQSRRCVPWGTVIPVRDVL